MWYNRNRPDEVKPIFNSLSISEADEAVIEECVCYPSMLASSLHRVEDFLAHYDSDITASLQQLFLQNISGIATVLNTPFVSPMRYVKDSPFISTKRPLNPRIQIVVVLCAFSLCRCVLRLWLVDVSRREER